MVVFYLRNSRAPDTKVVPITVALTLEGLKPANTPVRPDQFSTASGTEFPNLIDPEGEQVWLLIVATSEPDINGNDIPPEFINVVTTGTVHQEIQDAMGRIGNKVDWGTISPDLRAPELAEITPPLIQTTDVPITSQVVIRLKEALPAAGIDLSTVKVTLNGFDITNDLESKGNIFDLTLSYRPTVSFT